MFHFYYGQQSVLLILNFELECLLWDLKCYSSFFILEEYSWNINKSKLI